MKKMKFFMLTLGVALTAFLFSSCDNDDDGYSLGDVWGALVTVKPEGTGGAYSFVLDGGTTLWPAANHVSWYKPQENQRAIVYYTVLSEQFQGYDYSVLVRRIENILTKYPAENLGGEKNDEKYGTDPVKILDMWVGDGYLNVRFGFNYGGRAVHFINLVEVENAENPYTFEFRHNAYDDTNASGRRGLVAFNLSSLDVKEEVEITIKVNTFEGDKEYTIKYDPLKKETSESRGFSEDDITELQ